MRVTFSTRPYQWTHGKVPRGTGNWAFCPTDKYQRENYLTYTQWFTGAYSEAKRRAAAWAKANGVAEMTVCS